MGHTAYVYCLSHTQDSWQCMLHIMNNLAVTSRSYIVWCRRRDLAILVCAAVAAVVLGIETVAWLVNA